MPIAFRSACTRVAIWLRCALLEITTMLNSTGWPLESSSVFSAFQEKPADFNSSRACGNERTGTGTDELNHALLPGLTCVASAAARFRYTSRTIPARSMAEEIACRNRTSRNHFRSEEH